mgnify:CR=1 FL=1
MPEVTELIVGSEPWRIPSIDDLPKIEEGLARLGRFIRQ